MVSNERGDEALSVDEAGRMVEEPQVESAADAPAEQAAKIEQPAEAEKAEASTEAAQEVEPAETSDAKPAGESERGAGHAAPQEAAGEAGSPVEEDAASHTEVLAAVQRAGKEPEVDADDSAPGPRREGGATPPAVREVSLDQLPQIDDDLLSAAAGHSAEPAVVPAVAPVAGGVAAGALAGEQLAGILTEVPEQPEMRGNRGAGFLISLLATLGFAVVYAGGIALWLAPQYTAASYLEKGLLPLVLSLNFGISCAAFFCSLVLVVLIVGRAGWWAYVLGGFPVAAVTWLATVGGLFLQDRFVAGASKAHSIFEIFDVYGLALPAIIAAIVAREVVVWFGAWIGARGRRVKRENAAALAEYEEALARVEQSKEDPQAAERLLPEQSALA